MNKPDLKQQLQLNLQSEYNAVLRMASSAILEILLGKPASKDKIVALSESLRNAGKTSVPVSILLVINMLSDLEHISPDLEDILKKVLAHHSFEVVSDSLPPLLANVFNNLAVKVCENPNILHTIEHENEFMLLKAKLAGATVNLGQPMLVTDALKANLKAIAELISACESTQPEIFDYIKSALKSRYSAVTLINNGLYQKPQTTFTEAISARTDSILIKVTQMCFIAGLCAKNEEFGSYVLANFEQIAQAVDGAALLIGMWNDCGSEILMFNSRNVDPSFIANCLEESLFNNFRELIADRVKGAMDDDTQQLIQKVSSADPNFNQTDSQWRYLTQLVKDAAKSEPNILLDFGDINKTLDLLREMNCYTYQILESFLKSADIPMALKQVIAGAVYQHEILYGGVGDYYDEREDNFLLELYQQVQNRIRKAIA